MIGGLILSFAILVVLTQTDLIPLFQNEESELPDIPYEGLSIRYTTNIIYYI
tara:strand:+ start:164 stop:319 length:156 start_codon:yes stop_codon:yes gene_type:complete